MMLRKSMGKSVRSVQSIEEWGTEIVKSLDIGENVSLGCSFGGIMAQMDALTFEAAEEVFGNGVVVRITLTGHALTDTKFRKVLTVSKGGVLDAAAQLYRVRQG